MESCSLIKYSCPSVQLDVPTLSDLIDKLHQVFEKDEVNIEMVSDLMRSYKSNPEEWKRFAKFDRYRYTRNLVDEGNGKFNLMLLCWGEGHASSIHDHAGAHCFMKVLQGSLAEVRFVNPSQGETTSGNTNNETAIREISRNSLQLNDVCYINDSLGIHRVENTSHTTKAVSLHLYCPPFDECSVFNERTGHMFKCKVTFWSKYGRKTSKDERDSCCSEDN